MSSPGQDVLGLLHEGALQERGGAGPDRRLTASDAPPLAAGR